MRAALKEAFKRVLTGINVPAMCIAFRSAHTLWRMSGRVIRQSLLLTRNMPILQQLVRKDPRTRQFN